MNWYNFCTRCGADLTEAEQQAANQSRGPPLCFGCVRSVVSDIGEAIDKVTNSVKETLESIND